jgi:hypothetical protein
LTWAGKQAVSTGFDKDDKGKEFQPFNEMLSVGYFEKGYMGVSVPLRQTGLC